MNETRHLLSDAINSQCDTPQSSFHMLSFQELGGGMGGDGCSKSLSANSSKTAKNFKKRKIVDESR